MFAFAALLGFAVTLIRPALQALLPSLARTPEELIASNGATSTIESFGTLVGPLVAGVLVSVADAGVVFAAGAAALLVAAFLLLGVTVEDRISLIAPDEDAGKALAAGFGAIARNPRLRLVVSLIVAQAFVRGCLNVLIVVAAFQVLDAGGEAVGYMTAALGVGGLIGAIGAMALGGRRLAAPFGIALVFWGLPIAFMGPLPDLPFALLMLAVVGAANSVEDVAAFTLLQRLIPNRILTRVFGVVWSLAMGGVALGSIAAPALVEAVGPRPAFVAVGAILPLLSLATYRKLTAIDREAAPVPELELVQRVPMFQPLSVAAKERVAADLASLSVPAGEVVIRAGERGTASTSSERARSRSLRRVCGRLPMRATTSARSPCFETCHGPRLSRRSSTAASTCCNGTISSRPSQGTKRRARRATQSRRNGCRAQRGGRRAEVAGSACPTEGWRVLAPEG